MIPALKAGTGERRSVSGVGVLIEDLCQDRVSRVVGSASVRSGLKVEGVTGVLIASLPTPSVRRVVLITGPEFGVRLVWRGFIW